MPLLQTPYAFIVTHKGATVTRVTCEELSLPVPDVPSPAPSAFLTARNRPQYRESMSSQISGVTDSVKSVSMNDVSEYRSSSPFVGTGSIPTPGFTSGTVEMTHFPWCPDKIGKITGTATLAFLILQTTEECNYWPLDYYYPLLTVWANPKEKNYISTMTRAEMKSKGKAEVIAADVEQTLKAQIEVRVQMQQGAVAAEQP